MLTKVPSIGSLESKVCNLFVIVVYIYLLDRYLYAESVLFTGKWHGSGGRVAKQGSISP